MLLSKNFLKDYVNIEEDIKTIAEDMTKVGNEYATCNKLINATGLIIGEVIKCEMHPDSDHLHLCSVNIGKETLQIVCGAPNVKTGLKVIVAQVGALLPGDFKITKSKIRGIESCGMLCSLQELGLDNKFLSEEDKKGIHELKNDAPIGKDPVEYLGLDDEVIDFELTPNRGDLLSILGMAYEIGAIYKKSVKNIDLSYKEIDRKIDFDLSIDTDKCSLFLVKKVDDVTIKESPEFIKSRLIASGIRPINNVVDISNYVMLETGQPIHFYDSDNLKNKITVRLAKDKELLTTLDGNERTLTGEDIVITDGKDPVGLAGVMGGFDTEIMSDTKNITIECAIFDPYNIRKTANRILRSEASSRFEKGIDPNRTYMAMDRCCHLLEKYADAKIEKGIVSFDNTNREDKIIKIKLDDIVNLFGLKIALKDVINIFNRLGLKNTLNGDLIIVSVPTRRLDLNIKEDLIEEVGRIYGVDNIEGVMPKVPIRKGYCDKTLRSIRNKLSILGLNEVITYSLTSKNNVNKYTKYDFEEVAILSPMMEERAVLRYSLIPLLMDVYNYNKARGMKDISIFEIGKGFFKQKDKYLENTKLAALLAGKYYLETGKEKIFDFYIVKGIVEELLEYLGYKNRYTFVTSHDFKELHPGQTAIIKIDNNEVGVIGRVHPSIIKDDMYVFEINLDSLFQNKTRIKKYQEISKYPTIEKDVAFIIKNDVSCDDVIKTIKKVGGRLLTDIKVFDIYKGEKVKNNEISIAYNLKFSSVDRTLTTEEIDKLFKNIISSVVEQHKAILRDN